MVRLFIGVVAPENIKAYAVSLQNKIKKFVDAKFVERENLHISLSFLGAVEDSEVEKINSSLDKICGGHEKFEVKLGELKFIPSLNFARVVVLDAKNEILKNISKEIETQIGGDVKPPHLTLCRIRKMIDKTNLAKVSWCEESFPVEKIDVIKSELSRYGPEYTVIHGSNLI